ncbi:MAG: FAD-binding oxidoreductase, partial [Burkholderiales bacterium]|nr:FAD-binding oxidoreductase [Burkholderiales bacterium]
PVADVKALAEAAMPLETYLARERAAGRFELPLQSREGAKVLLHGHCHQKAFDAMGPVETVLRWIPGLEVETVVSSCCGMAGSFGYEAEHFDASMAMGELSLLPAVRAAGADVQIVADGTSCRHQITDGTGRSAAHVVRILDGALRA